MLPSCGCRPTFIFHFLCFTILPPCAHVDVLHFEMKPRISSIRLSCLNFKLSTYRQRLAERVTPLMRFFLEEI